MTRPLDSRLREILREQRGDRGGGASALQIDRTGSLSDRERVPQSVLAERAADDLDGDVVETAAGGRFLVVDRFYPLDHAHGLSRVGEWGGVGLTSRVELAMVGNLDAPLDADTRSLLFVDLETTGLAGGAGTYAFLVGCAYFEAHGFRTRQYFLPGYQHERPLLEEVSGLVRRSAGLVSYNGKSFDVPVLETRFQFNRMAPPFDGLAHVDMLHVARRFWRSAPASPYSWAGSDSCRLVTLERVLFGVRRVGDVPGMDIPSRYFDFMRTGDARPLLPVLEHNRLDLLSLAALTVRAVTTLADAPERCRTARESLAAGRVLDRAGRADAAMRCYEDAVRRARSERGSDAAWARNEALRALALRHRRDGRHDLAADAWQAIAGDRQVAPVLRREALEALAIHFEHRARDLDEARRFAERSLAERIGTLGMERGRHRLARLDRKLAGRAVGPGGPDPTLLLQD
jgi:uncharacterized protein YprB with RNaseH-like and TPR domain